MALSGSFFTSSSSSTVTIYLLSCAFTIPVIWQLVWPPLSASSYRIFSHPIIYEEVPIWIGGYVKPHHYIFIGLLISSMNFQNNFPQILITVLVLRFSKISSGQPIFGTKYIWCSCKYIWVQYSFLFGVNKTRGRGHFTGHSILVHIYDSFSVHSLAGDCLLDLPNVTILILKVH